MRRDLLPPSPQQGFAMVLVMFLVLIVAGLSFGLLQEGMAARTSLNHHKSNMRALEIAETGLVRAEMELRAQLDIDGGGIGAAEGTYGDGDYVVTVADDPISPQRWILRARGAHAHSTRRIEVGVRRRTGSAYADALFSMEDLPVSSVSTDAYDSRLGTYASQAVNSDSEGTYAEVGGGLGSNSDISLDGSTVWVRGNAIPGVDGDVIVSGSPTVLGDMAPRTYEVDLPPVPLADFDAVMRSNDNNNMNGGGNGNRLRYNANSQSLAVSGNSTVNFPSGTYFFRDVKIEGGTTLNMQGQVRIYIVGDFEIGSGSSIVASRPSDVELIVHPYGPELGMKNPPTTSLVKVNGGSQVTWAMYAPGATLDIGGGNDFYGAAVGNRIELNGNNRFHYDKALGETGGDQTATLERLYWRELSPPVR